ncbi:MAG: glycine cleavage T C-terminal barrel domain-containing protein, partial [Terriglobia bacterium]
RLVIFVLQDPEPVLWGGEIIYRNGQRAGCTTSGSYGHSLGAAVAMGYVRDNRPISLDFIMAGKYDIDAGGKRYPATAHLEAPYDPKRERVLV